MAGWLCNLLTLQKYFSPRQNELPLLKAAVMIDVYNVGDSQNDPRRLGAPQTDLCEKMSTED